MNGSLTVRVGGIEILASEMSRCWLEGIRSHYVRRLGEIALDRGRGQDSLTDIYGFLKKTFLYQPDPIGRELLISPIRFAEDYVNQGIAHRGDCDDLATLSAAVLGNLGYSSRILIVSYSTEWEHAYTEVLSKDFGWMSFDLASTAPLGWIIPSTKVTYVYLPN